MDYKKKYEEALEKGREFYNRLGNKQLKEEVESIFPELVVSEDERIRKTMIEFFKNYSKNGTWKAIPDVTKWIAWLEKQGEMDMESYKTAEDEKREFVGDGFIKCYADFQDFKEGETYWLEYIGNDNYNVRSDNLLGKTYHITPCQLYTIFKKQTWLEKKGEQKQELLTIEKALKNSPFVEQKPWSEEDESRMENLCHFLKEYGNQYYGALTLEGTIHWLKSLKDRIQPQPMQEWSLKEDAFIQVCVNAINDISYFRSEDKEELINWLKSLRFQFTWKPSEEQMITLEHYMHTLICNKHKEILFGLYQDLRKLKD